MGKLLLDAQKVICLKKVRTLKLNSEGLGKGRIKTASVALISNMNVIQS